MHPDTRAYSWWDYRQLGFPKNNGLRIDHFLVSDSALDTCSAVEVDRDSQTHELLAPMVDSVVLQLLAYHIAVRRGCDVDQPRNLAKSVTVE